MEKPIFLPGAILLALALPSPAALLLYEGFTGYTAGAGLGTITPNGNTTGLATSGTGSSYANGSGSNSASGFTIQGTGLSFGSLLVSGGAAKSANSTAVASAIITSTTASSVIWGSYLVNLSAPNASGSNGFEIRLNSDADSSSSTPYFRSDADTRGGASASVSVSYDTSLSTGTGGLTAGTTYIIISKFDTTAGATLWALTSSQFEDFVAAGRTESFLTGTSGILTASDALATANGWNTAGTPAYLEFVSSGMGTDGATFDEIRYGETLFDVTPVPEPASAALLGSAGFLFLRRRRK